METLTVEHFKNACDLLRNQGKKEPQLTLLVHPHQLDRMKSEGEHVEGGKVNGIPFIIVTPLK